LAAGTTRGRVWKKKAVGDVELQLGRDHAADQCDRGAPEHQQGQGDGQRHHLGKHQAQTARHTHGRQRVDFLGDAHHAQLRRHRRTGAPGDKDRHQHRTQFAHDAEADDIHDEDVRAKLLELQRRQIGQHHADEEPYQRRHRHRPHSALVKVGRNLPARQVGGIAQDMHQVQPELADQCGEIHEMAADADGRRTDHHHAVQRR
jgi:hypothetical protein